jgi:hypothetical protein
MRLITKKSFANSCGSLFLGIWNYPNDLCFNKNRGVLQVIHKAMHLMGGPLSPPRGDERAYAYRLRRLHGLSSTMVGANILIG